MVHVHELGFSECPKAYVFKGTKDYEAQQIGDLLGLSQAAPTRSMTSGMVPPSAARFLVPVADCAFALESILEDLQTDPVTRR